MPRLAAALILLATTTACSMRFGVEEATGMSLHTLVGRASVTSTTTAASTLTPTTSVTAAPATQTALSDGPSGAPPRATSLPPTPTRTLTPTPIPPTFTPQPTGPTPVVPTYTPQPTKTPTATPVPTVIPDFEPGPLPNGWFAYSKSVQLLPEPSPSAYGCHLILRRIDGSEERNLTPPETFQFPQGTNCATLPAFSPDGKRIAFLTGYPRNLGAGLGGPLMVMNIDGAGAVTLSASPTTPSWIVWSKDGAQIATIYRGDGKWHAYDIASGGAPTGVFDSLTPDKWHLPNISPDGVYRASYCEPPWVDGLERICITALADDPRPLGTEGLDNGITWTPDGGWIVFDGQGGAYAVRLDGSDPTHITELTGGWWFDR